MADVPRPGFFDRSTRHAANWSQAVAILIPLLLLAGLGIRGLQASQQAALDEARRQSERGLDQAWPAVREAWDNFRNGTRLLRLYPAPPVPVPPTAASRRYAEILASPPSPDRAADLSKLETDYPEALAPSGVPLVPLAEWSRLQLASDPAGLTARATTLRAAALRQHPSVLTPPLLTAAVELLHGRNIDGLPLESWQTEWDQDERARAAWRQHADEVSTAGPFLWVTDHDGQAWWVQRDEADADARRFFSRDALRDFLRGIADRVQPLLPDFTRVEFMLADVPLSNLRGEPLTTRHLDALSLRVTIASTERLFAQQRRQTAWLAALLVSAFAAALAAFWGMRRAVARERQLSRLKSDFVSSVSHELRAPVAAMRLLAENLEAGAVPTEIRQREYHRHFVEECRRLGALVDNVLDFARIEQNRKTYDFAETDVAALIADALALMQPRAIQRRQELVSDLQPVEPPPVCDGLTVRQALINLLENAIKFSAEGTSIRVGAGMSSPGGWEISVRDEGPGIAAAEHQKIFERFYRLGSELRRETQGAGIGLSIVRHIAEAHGGRVKLESDPGKGATFTLALPLRPPGSVETL